MMIKRDPNNAGRFQIQDGTTVLVSNLTMAEAKARFMAGGGTYKESESNRAARIAREARQAKAASPISGKPFYMMHERGWSTTNDLDTCWKGGIEVRTSTGPGFYEGDKARRHEVHGAASKEEAEAAYADWAGPGHNESLTDFGNGVWGLKFQTCSI